MDLIYPFYVFAGLIVGFVIYLALHYIADFPFPWQFRTFTIRQSEPDSTALSACFAGVSDKEKIHLVMGNISSLVCETTKVTQCLGEALQKDVSIELIHGPTVDKRSKKFLALLEGSSKVKVYQYSENPELHFRVILDSKGEPKEVYVEEPHRAYEDIGYRHIVSHRVSGQYEDLFQKMVKNSEAVEKQMAS